MKKILLEKPEQLAEIKAKKGYSLLFKHSTRCPVSTMALNRVESNSDLEKAALDYYYLDLIRYRDISNDIANEFSVHHESPQILLIKDGECVLDASHIEISPSEILEQLT